MIIYAKGNLCVASINLTHLFCLRAFRFHLLFFARFPNDFVETLIAIITNAHLIDRYWDANRSNVGIFAFLDAEFVHLCSVICLYQFRTIYYGFREMFHFVYIENCVNLKLLWNFIHAIVSHWYLFASVSECVHPFELVMWTMYVWPFRTNLRSWTVNFQVMKFIELKSIHWFFFSFFCRIDSLKRN